jgi:phospholipid N-methyltransferase
MLSLKFSFLERGFLMYNFFFKHFLRDPKNVGAIVPLSQRVAEQLVKYFEQRPPNKPWKILEVGAGAGNITKVIAKHMKAKDHLDIIEIDADCCSLLKRNYKNNPNVWINCLSILDWKPSYQYDFIISTLPLNSFSPQFVENILNHYQNISKKEAVCTYVEYIGLERLSLLFANKEKRDIILSRRKLLKNFHKNHLLKKRKVLTNFLPCYVYSIKLHNHSNHKKKRPLNAH